MRRISLIIFIILISEILPAQMKYLPYKTKLNQGFSINETNSNNEADKKRRSRGRRTKNPMFAAGGSLAAMKISESSFDAKFRIGLGADTWLNLSRWNALNANLFYFFPVSQEVGESKNTTSYFLVNVHFQQFLAGDNSENFGLYAIGGFAYIVNFNKTVTPAYDMDARYTNINLDLGIGGQFNLNFGFLFAEIQGSLGLKKYDIPLNPSDGVNVPSYISFRSGLKIPLQF